jgi:hypothetical protein
VSTWGSFVRAYRGSGSSIQMMVEKGSAKSPESSPSSSPAMSIEILPQRGDEIGVLECVETPVVPRLCTCSHAVNVQSKDPRHLPRPRSCRSLSHIRTEGQTGVQTPVFQRRGVVCVVNRIRTKMPYTFGRTSKSPCLSVSRVTRGEWRRRGEERTEGIPLSRILHS